MVYEQLFERKENAKDAIASAKPLSPLIQEKLIEMMEKTMERNISLDWPELVNEAVKRRKQQGLTQKQLATLVGISGPTVNSFEQGKTSVTLESCFKILRFLGLLDRK